MEYSLFFLELIEKSNKNLFTLKKVLKKKIKLNLFCFNFIILLYLFFIHYILAVFWQSATPTVAWWWVRSGSLNRQRWALAGCTCWIAHLLHWLLQCTLCCWNNFWSLTVGSFHGSTWNLGHLAEYDSLLNVKDQKKIKIADMEDIFHRHFQCLIVVFLLGGLISKI